METPHQDNEIIGDRQGNNYLPLKHQPPRGTRIQLNKTKKNLIAEIPSVGLGIGLLSEWKLGLLILDLVFGGLVLLLFKLKPSEDLEGLALFLCISIVPLTISLLCLGTLLFSMKTSSRLEIDEYTFSIQWKLLGFNYHQIPGKTRNIRRVEISPIVFEKLELDDPSMQCCTVVERLGARQFAMMLKAKEIQWLVGEISDFLTQLQSSISETNSPVPRLTKPRRSRVVLQKKGDRLIVDIPPIVSRKNSFEIDFIGLALASCVLMIFMIQELSRWMHTGVDPWVKDIIAVIGVRPYVFIKISLMLLFLLIWVIIFEGIKSAIYKIFAISTYLEIDQKTFRIEWRNYFVSRHQVRVKVADLKDVFLADRNINIGNQYENNIRGCILVEGTRKHSFGSHLKIKEQRLLVAELAEFLGFDKPTN